MNPRYRNQLISGINSVMEGLSQIGQALEADGWDGIEDDYALSGPRPVAAARLAEPSPAPASLSVDSASEKPVKQEASEPSRVEREYTLPEVRLFLAELSQQGLTAQVRELIVKAGANALSEVDPAKYGQIMVEAQGLAHA